MKTPMLLTGAVRSNKFYLLCLLCATLLQACTAKKEVVVSADVYYRTFSGPSYPNPSPEEGQPGVNVQYHYEFAGWHPPGFHMGGVNRTELDKLYASADKGAASVINPAINTPADDLSDFKYHIFFATGGQFVLKRSGGGGSTTSLGYLEVPFYALYRHPLPDKSSIFGGLGPYAGLGILGSAFSDVNGFKRFDAGVGFIAGYTLFDSFSFSLEYQLGLANIQKNAFGDKAVNRGFGLNVGYPLDKLIGKVKGQ
jgi:hypothetical protein